VRHPAKASQRGIALLMVLVIVAIATVLTVGMISTQQQVMRRAGSLFSQDQARLYVQGAEDLVKELIRNDTQDDKKDSSPRDYLGEAWAQPFPPFPVPGGTVSARLTDAQSKFNLNSLVQSGAASQPAIDYFQRLLRQLALPDSLVYALVDWEDADNNPVNADGAEDDFYSRSNPPYRAANRPLVSLSELHLVRGFTPEVIQALTPYVSVLPTSTPMNINTMGPMLMQSLVDGLSASAGEEMAGNRPAQGYKNVDDFLAEAVFNGLNSDQKGALRGLLDVRTNYFEMAADASIDGHHSVLVSVLQRGNSDTIAVISRDYGQKFQVQGSKTAAATPAGSAGDISDSIGNTKGN
jgi:general secretion pathway protein K